jgi:FkbM family methyltransferase
MGLNWKLRVLLTRLGIFETLDSGRLWVRKLARRPHEAEFAFFSRLEGTQGIFLDIGANAGQSAVSFRIFNHSLSIHSFEANGAMEPSLKQIRRLLGSRFEYTLCALGNHEEEKKLFIPVIDGVALTQEATFDRQSLVEDPVTLSRFRLLTGSTRAIIHEQRLRVKRLDDLGLDTRRIQAAKIDAQGAELEILRGMKRTLTEAEPVLLIEYGTTSPEVADYLSGLDYGSFRFLAATQQLVESPIEPGELNYFFLTRNRAAEFRRRGWVLSKRA